MTIIFLDAGEGLLGLRNCTCAPPPWIELEWLPFFLALYDPHRLNDL